jgi:hypothetical protein
MDVTEVYRIFHSTSTQYTFFSAAHGTFSKIDHILGHRASLSKYKKIEIISKIDWRCSSGGKTSALLLRSREFKPGPTQKKTKENRNNPSHSI